MKSVSEKDLTSDFQREYAWGDDQRYWYNPNRRKASVLGFFTRWETMIQAIKTHLPLPSDPNLPAPHLADFACAQGNFALPLAEAGYRVTAIDIQPDFLRYAEMKHSHGDFKTLQANIVEYRSPEGFDGILLGEVIEHVAFPEQLLRSVFENLKPGGIFVLSTPNGAEFEQPLPTFKQVTDLTALIPRQFHWGDHLFLYTVEELQELFAKVGLEWVEHSKLNSSYVTQLKGLRYLLPLRALQALERLTRSWRRGGKDSTNCIVAVGRRPK